MALIECKFCGGTFDDSLDTCVHCGKNVNEKVTKEKVKEVREETLKNDPDYNFPYPKEIAKKDRENFLKCYKGLKNDFLALCGIFSLCFVLFGFNLIYIIDIIVAAIGLMFAKKADKSFGTATMVIAILYILSFIKNFVAALLGIFLLIHSIKYLSFFKKK